MLHIILLILKILLFILLGILGLVLFLVLLVLFSPIRYRVHAVYEGKATVKAKIRFLFVSVIVDFAQETKTLNKAIKIFGIKLPEKKQEEGSSKKSKKSSKSNKKKSTETVDDIPLIDLNESSAEDMMSDENALYEGTLDSVNTDINAIDSSDKDFGAMNSDDTDSGDIDVDDINVGEADKKESLGDKIKRFAAKAKVFWEKLSPDYVSDLIDEKSDLISKKYKKLEKKVNRYIKFWNKNYTVKTRNYLKKYLITLIKHIGPRKLKGYVHYGFDDPAQTGQITGYLSLCPFMYHKKFSVYPDFHEKVVELDVDMKGKIRLGYILRIVLKPYIWKTIKVFRRLNEIEDK